LGHTHRLFNNNSVSVPINADPIWQTYGHIPMLAEAFHKIGVGYGFQSTAIVNAFVLPVGD
jgi:hypothetical protein